MEESGKSGQHMMTTLAQPRDYEARVTAEKDIFKDCVNVHDLPAIFHYWSNGKIRPQLEVFGFSGPVGMFEKYLEEQCASGKDRMLRFVSVGSGNCDLEIGLAQALIRKGYENFVLDCLDLNPAMLERGRAEADQNGVADRLSFVEADFNNWHPSREYDAVVANQALHHVVNLEGLFGQIQGALAPRGRFIISDMIGRNGHQLWPEALEIVHEFWRQLPERYRYNQPLRRYEELYENWDCSIESFEGIRAQDILPQLLEYFHFEFFFGCGNVIDPFVGRAFGPNFDPNIPWDREFIDRVHQRDQQEMTAGRIKPTHMLAVVGNDRDCPTVFVEPLTPRFCVRASDPIQTAASLG
jgi:SAM-dependent methyltransferase